MKEKIAQAYMWVDGAPHREWCNYWKTNPHQVNLCNCGRAGVLETLRTLKEMPNEHFVIFDENGWVVEHDLECRLSGTMAYCRAVQRIRMFEQDYPGDLSDVFSGRYLIEMDGRNVNLRSVQ